MFFQGAQSPRNGTPLSADYFCVDGFCHLRKISCVCVERVVRVLQIERLSYSKIFLDILSQKFELKRLSSLQ